MTSRMVSWFEVYRFAERWAAANGQHIIGYAALIPGTPQWCALPDDDARKLLALVLGGVREALNHDVTQELRADAGRVVADSADWSAIAQRVRNGRGPAYIPRRAAS
ncbi:DUF2742 domain-containing protein [Mycolicibacterium sp. J2]|uniref:DUF2742 domain-containing protein n=1 Tax=Mycolicibacterium sp. J2 TaxID=2993511 RepID=UPI00224A6882|nr:DUF2742 domain-containing protein [Mycolicibacterium sp. J2]MCX2712052.1 DUF2742 domain-containing protein [Mycolicibacterium sp. J2]